MRRPGRGARNRDEDGLREIDEELRLHIEGRTQELVAAGLSPADARRRALEAFGDYGAVRGEMRAIEARVAWRRRAGAAVAESWRDVRIGARRLRRTPGHAIVAILTLALGIGASVAMFTVLNAVVLRPLPYPDPDRLVRVWPASGYNIALSRAVGESLPSVTSYTGIAYAALTLEGVGDATALTAAAVDVGYFDVFGVEPLLGRRFIIEETVPARSGVVLLSHELWQSRFGGDPGIIGRRLSFKGYDHASREVIGVMVGARKPDFGIRLALGADRREVLWEALRAGLAPSLIGLALGLAGSIMLAGTLRGVLFGIPPLHVPTYIAAAAVLLAVATFASWVPAWRAARTDPLSVLRAE